MAGGAGGRAEQVGHGGNRGEGGVRPALAAGGRNFDQVLGSLPSERSAREARIRAHWKEEEIVSPSGSLVPRLLDPPDSGFLTLPSPLPDDVTPPESGDPVRVSLASISTPGRYGARAPPPQLARGRGGRGRESAEGELLTFRVGR